MLAHGSVSAAKRSLHSLGAPCRASVACQTQSPRRCHPRVPVARWCSWCIVIAGLGKDAAEEGARDTFVAECPNPRLSKWWPRSVTSRARNAPTAPYADWRCRGGGRWSRAFGWLFARSHPWDSRAGWPPTRRALGRAGGDPLVGYVVQLLLVGWLILLMSRNAGSVSTNLRSGGRVP